MTIHRNMAHRPVKSAPTGETIPRSGGALGGLGPALLLAWRAGPVWLMGYITATAAAGLVPVATVWLLKAVLDEVSTGRSVRPTVVGFLSVGLAGTVLPSVIQYVRNQVDRQAGRQAQSDLYLATSRFEGLARLETPTFRDRLRVAQQAGRSAPGRIADGVVGAGQGLVTLIGLLTILAATSSVMVLAALIGIVPALLAEIHLSRTRAGMLWRISPLERREFFYADLLTSLPAAKEIRLLGLAGLFRTRMLGELTLADGHRRRMDQRQLRVQAALGVLTAAVTGAGLVWSITAAAAGRFTVGEVSAFIAAIAALQGGLAALVLRVSSVHHVLLMFDHYRAVLRAEPDLPVAPDPVPVPRLRRGIELCDVWFRYSPDQAWALRGVNLVIPHGVTVSLVGANGAGKSTLVKLLCRFYDPQRGAIRWDGVDLRDMSPAALRERVAAVFQDFMSYDLTAAENIGLGDPAAMDDDARIRSAAQHAGVDGAIEALPRGYGTMLSRVFGDADNPDAGVLLSGGQWQRLALARAFHRGQRDLIILDEPSSGLDAAAEYEIHQGLRRHRVGATSVLISHRLGSTRDADLIVVLDNGEIVEQGTHAELVDNAGTYARLFRLQARGYQTGPNLPRPAQPVGTAPP